MLVFAVNFSFFIEMSVFGSRSKCEISTTLIKRTGYAGDWLFKGFANNRLVAQNLISGAEIELNKPSGVNAGAGKIKVSATKRSVLAYVFDESPLDPQGDGHGIASRGDGIQLYRVNGNDKPKRLRLRLGWRTITEEPYETFFSKDGQLLFVNVWVTNGPYHFQRQITFSANTGKRLRSRNEDSY